MAPADHGGAAQPTQRCFHDRCASSMSAVRLALSMQLTSLTASEKPGSVGDSASSAESDGMRESADRCRAARRASRSLDHWLQLRRAWENGDVVKQLHHRHCWHLALDARPFLWLTNAKPALKRHHDLMPAATSQSRPVRRVSACKLRAPSARSGAY